MLVLCQHCLEQFKPKRLPKGRVVTHEKCRSIFKISYEGVRLSCQHCQTALILKSTEENDTYLGLPIAKASESLNEITELIEVKKPVSEVTEVDSQQLNDEVMQSKTEIFSRREKKTTTQIKKLSKTKKFKRSVGSFVGSVCLFLFYLVLSNGLEGQMPKAVGEFIGQENSIKMATKTLEKNNVEQRIAQELKKIEEKTAAQETEKKFNTIENIVLPPSTRISSRFGYRKHPLYKKWRFHQGIDIPARRNSPVKAALSGKVIAVGRKGGYGNYVVLQHANGYTTLYGHNTKNIVKVGEWIEQGQTIALVGSTGHATGPHIHFELRLNGKYLNPLKHRYLHLEKMYREIL